MDVDSDIDSQLLQQFSSMGTQDKDVLIAEFQRLLGNSLNPNCCAFFLDMNNWNLQAAICSYYDYEQPNVKLPSMAFLKDETVGEGESVPPNTTFTKTWRIQNKGDEQWPPGCCIKFVLGEQFGMRDRVIVDPLMPGQISAVSVQMTSPTATGIYQSQWRMNTPTGLVFGDMIWVILTVEETGLLGLTQQLNCMGTELVQHSPRSAPDNPFFMSPSKNTDTNSQFGSPSLSTSAMHGSAPCSPSVLDTSASTHSSSPSSHIRTALFPSHDVTDNQFSIDTDTDTAMS